MRTTIALGLAACTVIGSTSSSSCAEGTPWRTPDLNADGVVNVLDVHLARFGGAACGSLPDAGHREVVGGIAGGETIVVVPDPLLLKPLLLKPGTAGAVSLRLESSVVPLFGYSLAVRAVAEPGTRGTVTVALASCDFGEPMNLIDAAPFDPPVDPLFTVILPWGADGVFVSTNTADGSTVLATPGVNDVLAEIAFIASNNASGTWTIALGPATALADGDGFAVPFAFDGGTIEVGGLPSPDPDINGDGNVDGADLGLLLGDWGPCDTLPPDLNLDGVVNGGDLGLLLASWDQPGGQADLNQDGVVNGADLGVLLGDWELTAPACADLTEDGLVDGADLGLLLSAFGA